MSHDHFNPNRFTDSAGVPWQGRAFEANPFADDDGTARTELIQAIEKFQASGDPSAVFEEFCKSRLLIPLVAALGETGEGANGLKVDKSAELSIVTVSAPDGATALPVFSSVQAMTAWNPSARPVPADAVRVALAAASEGNTRIVLDPTSATEFVFRRPAIAAIAQSQRWLAPHLDANLRAQIISAANLNGIVGIELSTGDPKSRLQGAELLIELSITAGLQKSELDELLSEVATAISAIPDIHARVDEMRFVLKSVS